MVVDKIIFISMEKKKIYVTIVGAGHYGKDLISAKYVKNKFCELKAVISPSVKGSSLSMSSLSGVPLYRTPEEWEKDNGKPSSNDLFDLCIHHKYLPLLVKQLVIIGAKNFVFPKPVAVNFKNLQYLLKLEQKYNLKIVVASQWYYSDITKKVKFLINEIKKKSKLNKIILNFSQIFSDIQLRDYSLTTALLPHMLQIIHSTGVYNLNNNHMTIISPKSSILKIIYEKKLNYEVELITNLKNKKKKRVMEIYTVKRKIPVLTVNFLGVFQNGKAIKYPMITYGKKTILIIEDNLGNMINKIIHSFSINNVGESNEELLTLKKYLPIIDHQIKIERKLEGYKTID